MKSTDLCKWLEDNSSGVYRPAKEAADKIRELEVRLHRLSGILHGDTMFEYSELKTMRELCDTAKPITPMWR